MPKASTLLPNISKAIVLCLAASAVFTLNSPAFCQSAPKEGQSAPKEGQSVPREWQDASGKFKVTGTLLKADDSQITLSVEGKGEITVEVKDLCDRDRNYVDGFLMVEQDELQYRLVEEHIDRLRANPAAAIEIMHSIHSRSPDAPYAAAMLGVAHAAGKAEYREAKKYLRIALRCVKDRQKVLGEDYHALTKLAVNNNLAVVSLKLAIGSDTVKLLRSNLELTDKDVNFCTRHNTRLLLKAVDQDKSPIKISTTSRRKLAELSATTLQRIAGFQASSKLLYFLVWSQPMSKTSFEALHSDSEGEKLPSEFESSSVVGNQLHPDIWCFTCQGTATLKCNNALCIRGEIEKRRTVVVRVDPNSGKKHYGTERYFVTCPTCRGTAKLKCPHCVEGKTN